jgi:hypothetical protein
MQRTAQCTAADANRSAKERETHMKIKCCFITWLLLVLSTAFSEKKEPLYQQLSRAVIRLEHFDIIQQEGTTNTISKNCSASDGNGQTAFES